MPRNSFDIAVIGGGLVGTALAHGMARPGLDIVLLDEGDVAYRASRGNFALVWAHGKGLGKPEYARWSHRAVKKWRGFADGLERETGIALSLEQPGGFLLFLDDESLAAQAAMCARIADEMGNDRFEVEVMDHAQVKRLLPAIGPEVVGGTFCPVDGHVNVLRLFTALHQACRRRGVDYRPSAAVRSIERRDGGYAIDAAGGTITAGRIVLAAGLGNARLAPMVGLDAPVIPERGQIIVTERTGRLLDYPTATVRQTDEGSIMIGASKERVGFDVATETEVIAELASSAVRMFPALENLAVVRSWAALRVMTPDGFPIYQADAATRTAFLLTCHSGVTLASLHAGEIAEAIVSGNLPAAFEHFSPARFVDVQAA